MKKQYNMNTRYLTIVAILLSLFSCTEEIDIPLDSTYARLVVEGAITTDTTIHNVKLTKSGDALMKDLYQPISDAIVKISDGTNEFILQENIDNKGVYETEPTVYGVPGRTYTLNISNVDIDDDGVFEVYTAESELRGENPIDSIKFVYDDSNPDYGGWMVNMYAKEIGGGRNFYLMKAYINDVLVTDSTHEYGYIGDNTGFNGKYFDGFQVYMLNKKKKDEIVESGDKITIEMDGINEGYFNFIYDFIQEYNPKIPIFSGPSANISTNIVPKDKAVGFFAAYSVVRCSGIVSFKK